MNQAKCTTCGAGLTIKKGDKTCVCEYCQSTNIVENALALGKVEVDVTEDIKKLRANLTTFVQHNSIDEILRVSQKLLDWIPQDFVALYFFGYAKQQQNQPRFLYDFYKEPPIHTQTELEVVVEHIISKSELRDKRRVLHWFESFGDALVQRYLINHKEREDQENNYANVPRDVFICFSSYNVEIAEKVVEELEADGNTCWISTRNLRPNDAENYWKNIENAIQKSSIVLVIGSEDSMRSKDVHQEIDYAKQKNKTLLEFKIDDKPHNTLFKHVFDGIKWIDGSSDVDQSFVGLLQRVYDERYQLPRPELELSSEPEFLLNEEFHQQENLEIENVSEVEEEIPPTKLFEPSEMNTLISGVNEVRETVFIQKRQVKVLMGAVIVFLFTLGIIFFPLNNSLPPVTDNLPLLSISFELNDGTRPALISLESGTKLISSDLTPTREGYVFEGWFTDELLMNKYDFENVPDNSLTLYAKWQANVYELIMKEFTTYPILNNLEVLESEKKHYISLSRNLSTLITNSGNIIVWGQGNYFNNLIFGNLTEISSYFELEDNETLVGTSFTDHSNYFLTSKGRVLAIDENPFAVNSFRNTINNDELSVFDVTPSFNLSSTDRILLLHSNAAITEEGEVYTWGYGTYGQRGAGPQLPGSVTPLITNITKNFRLENSDRLISLVLEGASASALTANGRIFTWGFNNVGQLGDGSYENRDLPTEITQNFKLQENEKIIKAEVDSPSFALTSKGRIFTWGGNSYGQLGDLLDFDRVATPTEITMNFDLNPDEIIIDVYKGKDFAMALTNENRIFSWGRNTYGQLGDGTRINNNIPINITTQFNLIGNDKIINISLGYDHSAALTSNGVLFTWGRNNANQLGQKEKYEIDRFDVVTVPTIVTSEIFEEYFSSLFVLSFDSQLPNLNPTRIGFVFDGWYTNDSFDQLFSSEKMPPQNMTLYARWYDSQSVS